MRKAISHLPSSMINVRITNLKIINFEISLQNFGAMIIHIEFNMVIIIHPPPPNSCFIQTLKKTERGFPAGQPIRFPLPSFRPVDSRESL